jgi:hypothetical protein
VETSGNPFPSPRCTGDYSNSFTIVDNLIELMFLGFSVSLWSRIGSFSLEPLWVDREYLIYCAGIKLLITTHRGHMGGEEIAMIFNFHIILAGQGYYLHYDKKGWA